MLFLAIETSSAQGSLALFRDRDVVKEVFFDKGLTFVRDIAEYVRGVLQSEGLTVRAVEGIAVSVGPGSYTGVRVGVTAAKTLGFALEIPVVGVESLRVLAANLALADRVVTDGFLTDRSLTGSAGASERALVATILDGRQRFLYGSLYEVAAGSALPGAIREVLPQTVEAAGELCRTVSQKVEEQRTGLSALVIGDGAAAFLEIAGSLGIGVPFEPGPEGLGMPRARAVGLLAEPELARAIWDREAVHRLEPLYLRVTEAERRLMEAKKK